MREIMTPDNLDTLSDAELNECFAVEVAGFDEPLVKTVFKNPELVHLRADMNFSADANTVLPFLAKHVLWTSGFSACRGGFWIEIDHKHEAEAPAFARAACIALIRAKRASKPTP